MPKDVFEPFDADVQAHGGYLYADGSRKSAVYANGRNSRVILESVDFKGRTVVDVGCGDGSYTRVLRDNTEAASILGIDPAAQAVTVAAERHAAERDDIAFRNCFAADLVREGRQFDVAVCRGVIHHVADPAAEIATILKLARTVFFIDPNGLNPVLKLLEQFSSYHKEHKERSYRMGQFRKWIRDGGGEIKSCFYHGLVPMFAPDLTVPVCAALEPLVEALPLIRTICCGRMAILAQRAEASQPQTLTPDP